MNILISSAGRRVALVRIAGAAVQARNPRGRVIATDSVPELSAACHVADAAVQVPPIASPDFLDVLLDVAERNEVGLIIPTLDTELAVLAGVRDSWAKRGIHIAVSDPDFIKIARDKRLTSEFFKARGFAVPQTLEDNDTFPRFIKPIAGSLSTDTHGCHSQAEVRDEWFDRSRYVHQEFVDRDAYTEFTVDIYCDRRGNNRCAVPRRRIEVRGGEIAKGRTEHGILEQTVLDRLATIPGARGCLTAQFFVPNDSPDPSQLVAIEVNARFGGGYPLSDRAGAHYVQWLLAEHLEEQEPPQAPIWTGGVTMLRFDDAVFTS